MRIPQIRVEVSTIETRLHLGKRLTQHDIMAILHELANCVSISLGIATGKTLRRANKRLNE